MPENIGNFNFKIIDISISGSPVLYVNRHCITFSRRIAADMDYPEYVQPLIDIESKAFAIKICKQTDVRAMSFYRQKGKQKTGVVLSSEPLRKLIKTIMAEDWKEDKRYKIMGTYLPDSKAMVFDLKTASEEEVLWSHFSKRRAIAKA